MCKSVTWYVYIHPYVADQSRYIHICTFCDASTVCRVGVTLVYIALIVVVAAMESSLQTTSSQVLICTSFLTTQLESGNGRKRTTSWRLNSQPTP